MHEQGLPNGMADTEGKDGALPSQAELAYREIEELIVTRGLAPGAMISEKRLMDEVLYGRTPVREALQRLKLEGYIEIHPSRGVQVSAIDIFKQFELLEVRRPLEDLMVRLAADRASTIERARMEHLAQVIRQAASDRDRLGFLRSNRSVHETLAQASKNTILAASIGVLHGLSRRFWYAYIEDVDVFEKAAEFHANTLNATAARDGNSASLRARDFLNFLENLTTQALNKRINLKA